MGIQSVVLSDPEIMNGEIVFAGSRVLVQTFLDHLKAGDTLDTFLEDFPTVKREQAQALLDLTLSQLETALARAA